MSLLNIMKSLIDLFNSSAKTAQDVVKDVPVETIVPVETKVSEGVKLESVKKDLPPIAPEVGEMQISKKGYLETADREGLALVPYLDSAGIKTVGIGMTVSDIPDLGKWSWSDTISIPSAIALYKKSVQKYADAVNKILKVPVTQNQFDALVSITYNIGTGNVKLGVGGMAGSTFMKRINAKASVESIINAILMWDKPKEIIGRRQKEADLFSRGIYNNKDGCVDLISVNTTTHKPAYKGRINIEKYL